MEMIPPQWSTRRIIQWAIDLEPADDEIVIDQKRIIAGVRHPNRSPGTAARTSIAEQLTGLHIENQG